MPQSSVVHYNFQQSSLFEKSKSHNSVSTESKIMSSPLLSLRMKSNRSTPPSERFQASDDGMADRVRVMMVQEESAIYKCRDYLLRRKLERKEGKSSTSSSYDLSSCPPVLVNEIDTLCREKMCEWAYRVVDHFQASREIIAIAFSYLDRFVDRCCCDRLAFKLAAMTSIYMATKIFNSREISMRSLAELSRGEFDVKHITEMEGMILQTLEWRMHPPTTQCFINHLHALVPLPKGPITRAIYQRATFFAELSLFDYCFVTQSRSTIAVAALMNAMEGMEGAVSMKDQEEFYRALDDTVGQNKTKQTIDTIRSRLWYVYSQSAQYQEDDALPGPQQIPKETRVPSQSVGKESLGGDSSPVCVSVVSRQ